MSSVAVYSPKGGVGKSTLAVNLAYLSATTSRRRTLLWDIDAQGAATYLLGQARQGAEAHRIFSRDADPAELALATDYPLLRLLAADTSLRRLDLQLVEAEARKRLRKILRSLDREFDRVILDCPPGVTEVSEQIFRAADLIVIPVPPSALGVRAYEEALAHIRQHHPKGPPILPVLSMVDTRRTLHRQTLAAHPDWPVIPQASVVERMSAERRPLSAFAPRHPAARAFAAVWAQVETQLSGLEAAQP
jgi:chromosome partitioning protein